MSNFRVGQKVVCIEGSRGGMLVKGQIYTVEDIIQRYGKTYICPVETPRDIMGEKGWLVHRFRPLITPEQDIALFHALCPGLPVVPPAILKPRVRVE